MQTEFQKPIIGFSCGDINGIGIEIIIKSLCDPRMLDLFVPVVFASSKSINFYKKGLSEINFNYTHSKDCSKLSHKQVNVINCWEEDVAITPGILNEIGGKYALLSLQAATMALEKKEINALVTAPIHKKNVYSDSFKYSGHTPYFKDYFKCKDVLMFMVAENLKVGLLTEHIPIADVAKNISKEAIISKLKIMHQSLQKDFGVEKPRIAVLGLNPHAGDEGLIGNEEETIIKPAIKEVKQQIMAFGPYSADAFFARAQFNAFDGVLALYHDQGLIPFKSLAIGEGTNFTAGLPVVRTSPDHGTAFDIAGKNKADETSFIAAIFAAIDIFNKRNGFAEARINPLKKLSAKMVANAYDEKLDEN